MSKEYTQKTAALNAVTVDTHILDANKILLYPGTGERSERTNILDIIKNSVPEDLENRVEGLEDVINGNYASTNFTSNTSGNSNETEGIAIQFSKKHFLPEKAMIKQISLPYTGAVQNLYEQYCHLYYYNSAGSVIATHISLDKQSRAKGATGISTWTFDKSCIIPVNYAYVRVCLSGSGSPAGFGSTSKFRINVVNINGVTFDDDECCTWKNTTAYDNYLGDISVVYGELIAPVTEQIKDLTDKVELLESNSSTDFAKKGEANTFTAYNTFEAGIRIGEDNPDGTFITPANGISCGNTTIDPNGGVTSAIINKTIYDGLNSPSLADTSVLNRKEMDTRYGQLAVENHWQDKAVFLKEVTIDGATDIYDSLNVNGHVGIRGDVEIVPDGHVNVSFANDKQTIITENGIRIDKGILTFNDPVDGTVITASGASGYQYIEGMPASFNNGICYDIGEISNSTDLSNVTFSAAGRLVQTCELWFKTPATVPTTHQWPKNIYWIDSATGAAPTLIASKNYRLVFRQEPNKIIASIAYLY